jgi:mono/diheme cytochrome c family protein
MMKHMSLAAMVLVLAGAALAAPRSYDLPEPTAELRAPKADTRDAGLLADGFAAAQGNCAACHSVDYIAMQPPGKGRAFWDAEVAKMIKVYHAPIDEAQAKSIAAYLADTY